MRNQQDIWKARLQTPKIKGAKWAVRELDRGTGHLGVGNFVELVSQSDLVEDFHHRGMNGVAAELAVEILVHFEQRHRDAAAREEQRQHGAARPSAHDAARGLLDGADFFDSWFRENGDGDVHWFNRLKCGISGSRVEASLS